ncbi:MAG: EamA family transporter [Thiobacillus sp.]|nr:EamA family transporter [Thiobacillus sp.]
MNESPQCCTFEENLAYPISLKKMVRKRIFTILGIAAFLAVTAGIWLGYQYLSQPALPPLNAVPTNAIALLQGANLCFAAGQLGYRRLRRTERGTDRSEAGNLAWMYLGAAVFAVVAAAVAGRPADLLALSPAAGWALLYLGLVPSGVAFYLWNRGAARVGAGSLAAANNLKVPLGVVIAWTVFGEPAPYARVLLGLAVVIGAVLWAVAEEKRPEQS